MPLLPRNATPRVVPNAPVGWLPQGCLVGGGQISDGIPTVVLLIPTTV
jgi:hypothetical protein